MSASGLVTDELRAEAGRLGIRHVVPKEDMNDTLVDAVRTAPAPSGVALPTPP